MSAPAGVPRPGRVRGGARRQLGAVAAGLTEAQWALVERFASWLRQRGYTTSHRRGAACVLLAFLDREDLRLGDLRAGHVSGLRAELVRTRGPAGARHLLWGLAAFLRFLASEGLAREGLAQAVRPAPAPVAAVAIVGPASDPFRALLGRVEQAMEEADFTAHTRRGYLWAWRHFLAWAEGEGLTDAASLGRTELSAYRVALSSEAGVRGHLLAPSTQRGALAALAFGFAALVRAGWLLGDPTIDLPRPRGAQRLPRTLSARVLSRLLGRLPDDPGGLRDRAMLELLYGSGLRRGELVRLSVSDVDFEAGSVLVRQGKGRKDRLVPLGRCAREALIAYVEGGREAQRHGLDVAALFLSSRGTALTVNHAGRHLTLVAARHGVRLTPHVLRHTCATELLRGGGDIRQIQRLLGHASLASTERYTHVAIEDLREVVRRCHPRERGRVGDRGRK